MWLFDWVFNVLANLGLYHKSAKIRFKTFDLGGHETARRLWKDYFTTVDGVVYMVDALDKERFSEAKRELDYLLTCDELASVPFLVLGNKIDAHSAASEDDLRYALGLFETYGKDTGRRPRRATTKSGPSSSSCARSSARWATRTAS